jgi:serine/threonine protein kinase
MEAGGKLGPYHLVREIGRGGMGVVLKATDSRDGRTVAIKLINGTHTWDERSRIALVREAGATAGLEHPNVVSIYDVNQQGGNLYIVMEYLDGISLDRLMRQDWPLALKLQFIAQLCDALAYAQDHGIVHRDVKPNNMLILRDASVKVVDFGIAALAQISEPKAMRYTGTGVRHERSSL